MYILNSNWLMVIWTKLWKSSWLWVFENYIDLDDWESRKILIGIRSSFKRLTYLMLWKSSVELKIDLFQISSGESLIPEMIYVSSSQRWCSAVMRGGFISIQKGGGLSVNTPDWRPVLPLHTYRLSFCEAHHFTPDAGHVCGLAYLEYVIVDGMCQP